jgi:RNA polymerase sigma-70 factor (ECF subfamily)
MTGSVHDAEDMVQETLLRAWRGYAGFEQRAALRTWLYRIATNVCLNALERGPARRVLPAGLGAATNDPGGPLQRAGHEVAWLQPIPDRMLADRSDPSDIVVTRESIRLAFIAALQHLPARQRAILILRDVLDWRAAEVAEFLHTTTASVNGALLRARKTIASLDTESASTAAPDDPVGRALLDRYVEAFERADVTTLARLLHTDAQVQMPPHTTWFTGIEHITTLFGRLVGTPGQVQITRTQANGQPALAVYLRDGADSYRLNSIHVLAIRGTRVAAIIAFVDSSLFALFDIPLRL